MNEYLGVRNHFKNTDASIVLNAFRRALDEEKVPHAIPAVTEEKNNPASEWILTNHFRDAIKKGTTGGILAEWQTQSSDFEKVEPLLQSWMETLGSPVEPHTESPGLAMTRAAFEK